MAKLKDRQTQIPNGFRFRIPELKYHSSFYASFASIVNSVHTIVNANPQISEAHGWPLDLPGIEDWVDQFNAAICEANGWKQYYIPTEGGIKFYPANPGEWPVWAKAIKLVGKPPDAGVGDTIHRLIGDENSATFKAWYHTTFGRTCGCHGRQKLWNQQYHY